MAQTAPRPTYKFIPKPIEQQLAAYQPGVPLDYYQLGWKRGSKGDRQTSSKLLCLLLTPIGLVASIVAIIGLNDIIQTTHLIVSSLVLILILPFTVAIIGIAGLFQPSPFCFVAFSEGLIYAKKTRVTFFRWHEIASCEQATFTTFWYSTFYKYTIRMQNGKVLQWKSSDRGVQNLIKTICENIARQDEKPEAMQPHQALLSGATTPSTTTPKTAQAHQPPHHKAVLQGRWSDSSGQDRAARKRSLRQSARFREQQKRSAIRDANAD